MKKVERILRRQGEKRQRIRAVKCLSSLQDSILSNVLDGGSETTIMEDMADVYILLEQLKIIYDFTDQEINLHIKYKIEKALGR